MEETITAFAAGDTNAIRSTAPEFRQFDDRQMDAIVDTFRASRPQLEWSIDSVEIEGKQAVARVMITSDAEGESEMIELPLRWKNDRWEFAPRVSVEQHYDHVPIE